METGARGSNCIANGIKGWSMWERKSTWRHISEERNRGIWDILKMENHNVVTKKIIVTCPVFAWLKRRVLDFMIELIGPSYNWLQQFINHYLTHCHLPTEHFTGTIPTFNWTELNSEFRLSSYTLSARTYRKHIFCCQECVFTGPLPSTGYPSTVDRVCCGNVFTDPLPRSVSQYIFNDIFYVRKYRWP
jgi:hypothetical protein